MGRPESSIQRCFTKSKTAAGAVNCLCKGCGKVVSNVCSRMRTHASHCKLLQALGVCPTKKPTKEGTVKAAFSRPQHDQINRALARCMYASNLPFVWVKSPAVKSLVESLAPGAIIAERRHFAGPLLTQEHQAEVEKLRRSTEGGHYTLSIDGWSTADNIPLLGFGLCGRLVAIVEDRKEKHTAQWLADTASCQMALLKQVFRCEIVAVCSDGASNMEGVNFFSQWPSPIGHPICRNEKPPARSTPKPDELQMPGTCHEPGGTRFF